MADERFTCPLCGTEVEVPQPLSRSAACPACHDDLHVCLACRFHDPAAHNQCREPKAEWQQRRDRANYCDLFELKIYAGPTDDGGKEDRRQTALDDLFKNF